MARNLYHRDFTMLKAGLLAGLLGLAALLGEVPHSGASMADHATEQSRLIPAALRLFGADCGDDWAGTSL